MASLFPGFEYDIFISYRHNDNRSGWVTEFVAALKEELAATIKEPLSIYFDQNPHDGLLETHHVDKSLEGKLKCLIFIPIISQTYCDPKSFAWQHEFCAFNKLAKEDSMGRDVLLNNGNVTSRILPIKIHELDAEDSATIETEIGGVLRAIAFIHKSAGVNRPLTSLDDQVRESGKILYRDQVNKVANSVKEIVAPIKPSGKTLATKIEDKIVLPTRNTQKKGAIISAIVFLLALAAYFLYPKVIPTTAPVEIEKSIAVLPFVNMSNDPDQEYFSDGVMEEILTHLFKIGDLRVTSRTSTMAYKGTTKNVIEIGKELHIAHILEGSVQKDGDKIRITVQLIDATTDQHIWAERYDRELKDVFAIQSEVAQLIAKSLKANISPELEQRIDSKPTISTEAYELLLKGRKEYNQYYSKFDLDNIYKGVDFLNQAIALDSSFSYAYSDLARAKWMLGQFAPDAGPKYWQDAKKYALKAIELDPYNGRAYVELAYIQFKWEWDKVAAEESYNNAIHLAPGDTRVRSAAVSFYQRIGDCEKLKEATIILKSMEDSDEARSRYFLALCLENSDLFSLLEPDGGYSSNILMHQNKYEEAIESLIIRIDNIPYDIESRAELGEAYALIGNLNKAEQAIKELNDLSGSRNVSKCHFATIYMALGKKEKAFQLLEEALEENDFCLHVMKEFSVSIYRNWHDPRMVSIIERSWIPRRIVN